jgi:hypothetical protein
MGAFWRTPFPRIEVIMSRVRETTAVRVIQTAIHAIGIERLAAALNLSSQEFEPFARGEAKMNLRQQRVLAAALLALSAEAPTLRRDAAKLLAQVNATEDFEDGQTERHMWPPPSHFWS